MEKRERDNDDRKQRSDSSLTRFCTYLNSQRSKAFYSPFFLPFLGGKSGLITHNQNLYVNKKMGKNLFLLLFSLERDFQDCDCDVEPILYIFFLVKAFSKHRETSTVVGWLILLSKSPPLMSLSTFDTTSIMAAP